MTFIHKANYLVRTYEVDANGRLALPFLTGYMQESAAYHAAALGVSMEKLHAAGVAWALYRMRLEIIEMPVRGEQILVETWPSGMERFSFFRDHRVISSDGKLLAQSTSTWLMFDLQTRRLTPPPDPDLEILSPEGVRHLPRAADRFKVPAECPYSHSFPVRRSDLDINQHVNNLRYFQWLTDAVPGELIQNLSLREIDIIFRQEGKPDDILTIQTHTEAGGGFLQRVENQGGEVLVQAKSLYGPRG